VGGVLDHGPPLEESLLLVAVAVQRQSIARFPDWRLHHVAHAHRPAAIPLKAERDRFLLPVVAGGENLQRLLELPLELAIQKADALNAGKKPAFQSLICQQIELIVVTDLLFLNHFELALNTDNASLEAERASLRILTAHGHAFAAHLMEQG